MRVAIVGSRRFSLFGVVRNFVDSLPSDTIVISGGAPGVDTVAIEEAVSRGLETVVYKANWSKYGSEAGFVRNGTIVENADQVVAFWDGYSNGTLDTIKKAKLANKPIRCFVLKVEEMEPWLL